jgi:DUF4097 and DUF4098 domain-containing protein YvlB
MSSARYVRASFIVILASLGTTPLAFAASEGQFERMLTVTGPVNLEIESGAGDIRVFTGSSGKVHVTGRIRASSWFHIADEDVRKLAGNPPIQQSGNDIRIGHIDDPELRRHVSVSYEVAVPQNTQLRSSNGSGNQDISEISGPVDASTGSGAIKISGIGSSVRAHSGSGDIQIGKVVGSVLARAGSGSIRATEVAGGFDGQTGSGRLVLEQSAPGSVRAETGSGSLELHNLHGSLRAQTGSGTIQADGEATGAWFVRTGSGDVELRVPQSASFDLDAHTGSGSIRLNHPVTVDGSTGKKNIRGKVRGGGVPIEVNTGSGSIRID